jgi:hypothetical protein
MTGENAELKCFPIVYMWFSCVLENPAYVAAITDSETEKMKSARVQTYTFRQQEIIWLNDEKRR